MNQDILNKCEAKMHETIARINSIYKVHMPTPRLTFDLRGCSAGQAKSLAYQIRINPILLSENPDQVINQTLPHEVAHLATIFVYKRYVRSHGREWKSVMCNLGLRPERCHHMDVSNAKTRNVKTYEAVCKCRTHKITSILRNKMKKGHSYRCKVCKTSIKIVENSCLHS